MGYVSPMFSALEASNDVIASYLDSMSNEPRVQVFQIIGNAVDEVIVRVIAVFTTVFAVGAVALFFVPQLSVLNARLLGDQEIGLPSIIKANWAFIKVVFFSLQLQGSSIICPKQVHREWGLQRKFLHAIAETLTEIPANLAAVATSVGIHLDSLPDRGARIDNFRTRLAGELTNSLVRKEIQQRTYEADTIDPDFIKFNFALFDRPFRAVLLTFYTPQEIAQAEPLHQPFAGYGNPVQDQGSITASLVNFATGNHVTNTKKQFSELLKMAMERVRDELIRSKIYTVDEVASIDAGAYAAILDRAIFSILESAVADRNSLRLLGEKADLTLSKTRDTHGIYPVLKKMHADIIELMSKQVALLIKLLNRRDEEGKSFEHELPDGDIVKKIFNGIVALRGSTLDNKIMNNYAIGDADKTDFMAVFQVA